MVKLENKMNFYFKNTKKDIIMEVKKMKNILEILIFVGFVNMKYKIRSNFDDTMMVR